jgi:MFS family permease
VVSRTANRLSPLRFVVAFGVVSMLADLVYEGARSIVGPFLATFGASATLVGLVTGLGEAVALVLRLGTGRLSDRTGRHWALSITGYAITVVSVPLLAAAQGLWQAGTLVVAERFGKAVRAPARDTMLAQASAAIGRGRAFALHEALDQSGALLGPLLVAAMVALSGFRLGFAVLAVPGAMTLAALAWLRAAVPAPAGYESARQAAPRPPAGAAQPGGDPLAPARFPARFWLYAAFTSLSMSGFATFGLLSYHLEAHRVVPAAQIPVIYAMAMGVAALASLASGRAYDRIGLRGLLVLPPLSMAIPLLALSTSAALVWAGNVAWGAVMGVHESTMRAAVADLVPRDRRGAGFGAFSAIYGLAWLAGGVTIGALYGHSVDAVVVFTAVLQTLALLPLLPLIVPPRGGAAQAA